MPVPNPVFLLVPYRLSTGTNSGSIFSQLPINGTGDFTYTRPGSASFVGSNGNIQFATSHAARILNYYSGSGTCPALLVEPAATNAFQRSEEFEDAYWTKNNVTVTTNATIAPDGTMTADKITATTTGTDRRIQRADTIASGTYTTSIFIKAAEINTVRLYGPGFNSATRASFTLTGSGTVSNLAGATAQIQNYGNGWYRCSVSAFYGGGSTQRLYLNLELNGGNVNAGDGLFVWGAQSETDSVPTSYIPTTTAAVTRNPDNSTDTSYTLPLPNGTMYTEHFASRTSSYYAHSVGPIPITTGSNRIAVSYTPSKIAVYKNGSFLMSQSIGTYEVGGSIINLGHSSGSYQLNDNLLAFAVYDSELTPADAISLTSGSL